MTQLTAGPAPVTTTRASRAADHPRVLLACGVAAGPLYLAVAALQMAARDGFDLRRHAVSLLGNGELGWIQITNFIITGLLTVACAVGLRRALPSLRGATWGPRLVGLYGAGLVAAGGLVADPAFGFPVGTPTGPATAVSWHGVGHVLAGAVGFTGLIAACLVFARCQAASGQPGRAAWSATTGVLFLAAFAGIASGTQSPMINLAFTAAVALGWTWLSVTAAAALRTAGGLS